MEKDILIITGGQVLTCDGRNQGGRLDILVRDGRIVALLPPGAQTVHHPEIRRIDASNKLIIPGLINAHFHPESLLLRPLTEGLHFDLWENDIGIRNATARLLRPDAADDVRSTMLLSSFSHIKAGTVAAGLFPPLFDTPATQILVQCASRAELKGVLVLQTWQQVELARSGLGGIAAYFLNLGMDRDFTVYNLGMLARTAKEMNCPLLAHVAERRWDEEVVRANFQKSPGQVFRDIGVLQPETVLVHCNHLQDSDLTLIEEAGSTIVVCARSAAMKQTGSPLLRRLAARNIRLALGSDWGSTDMLEEIRFLARLPRLVAGMPVFSPTELLRMATINGAIALGLGAETGSIEPGKKADLVFLALSDLRLPPLPVAPDPRGLAEYLTLYLTSRDITDVMIDGQFAVSGGNLATMTEDDLLGGFSGTLQKWYASPVEADEKPVHLPPPPEQPSRQAPVIPLVQPAEENLPEPEGFEEGFTVIGPRRGVPRKDQSQKMDRPLPSQAPEESERPPELPKDVRRTFGDDDEA